MTNGEITVFGLVLDIIGVGLLWRFGLPPEVRRGGKIFMEFEQEDEAEAKKARIYDFVSHTAIALIVLGFVLQAIGTGAL